MKIGTLILLLLLTGVPGVAQNRTCIKIMTVDEIILGSAIIARVKIAKAEKVNYRGMYAQLARMDTVDVLDGDFTLSNLNVLAQSNVPCAEDSYKKGQDMLVFLVPQDSLYRTLNFQYGEFSIDNNVVKGWRDKDNNPVDRPYDEVKQQIISTLTAPPPKEPAPKPSPKEGPQPKPTPPPDKPAEGKLPSDKVDRKPPTGF